MRSSPVMQLKSVVLPEPLGPIRPWILPAPIDSEQRSTAVTPPKRFTTFLTSRRAASGMSDGAWQGVVLTQDPEYAPRHQQHDGDDEGPEQGLVDPQEPRPHHLLKDGEQHGAEHGPQHRPRAAEQAHYDHGDGGDKWKHAHRLDVTGVPGIEAADDTGESGRQEEGVEFVARGV